MAIPSITIVRSEYDAKPWLAWNAFVDIVGSHDYEALSPTQQVAHLAFRYDAEVQNGGHLQYFTNWQLCYLDETVVALGDMNALVQQQTLQEASELYNQGGRRVIEDAFDYSAIALLDEFGVFDRRYHRAKPSLTEFMGEYLRKNFDSFVVLVDEEARISTPVREVCGPEAQTRLDTLSDAISVRVRRLVREGRQLEAVRELRTATGCSLDEAKSWLSRNR